MNQDVILPDGVKVPSLGIGTWRMGERRGAAAAEQRAIEMALDSGITLIDTAEMYGEGGAERIVGRAIQGRRDSVFLVSKVYPHNADRRGMEKACVKSLQRLGVEQIDLYLLHWPGGVPLEETVAGFEALVAAGKIRYWGVSNFDCADMQSLFKIAPAGSVTSNQVLFNLRRRWPETGLVDICTKANVPIMAYSPYDQGALLTTSSITEIAEETGYSPAVLALGWLRQKPQTITIPKAVKPAHVQALVAALDQTLPQSVIETLEHAFPVPPAPAPLEIY